MEAAAQAGGGGAPPHRESSGELAQGSRGEAGPPRAERVAAWDRGASILGRRSGPEFEHAGARNIQARHRANWLLTVCEAV